MASTVAWISLVDMLGSKIFTLGPRSATSRSPGAANAPPAGNNTVHSASADTEHRRATTFRPISNLSVKAPHPAPASSPDYPSPELSHSAAVIIITTPSTARVQD